ncbi:hypothetical protein [Halorubrum sp. DM2]|uniref:hypothetical protein n=1 Tax=Halorubrum sp. DM2 TaxID=2527867 RepID=UPI0024B6E5CF|nr:hypothetical protein [Halorubrum sp. DM2]
MADSATSNQSVPLRDVGILVAIVVLLGIVHVVVPDEIRFELLFYYGEPTAYTPWTAVLIHDSLDHLTSNLVGYGIVLVPTYLLSLAVATRRRFWMLFGGICLITPPATIAVDYLVLYRYLNLASSQTVGFGFSGVVSALVGMLLLTTVAAVEDWYNRHYAIVAAVAMITAGGAGAAFQSGFLTASQSVLVVGAVAGIAGLIVVALSNLTLDPFRYWDVANRETLILVGTSGVIVSLSLATLFRVELGPAGRFVSVLGHGTGMLTGIALTLIGDHLSGS